MTSLGKAPYNDIHFHSDSDRTKDGVLTVSDENIKRLDHPEFAPTWDFRDDHAFTNPKPFRHLDRAFFGDPNYKSLSSVENISFKHVTPKLGLEVDGIQLSKLTDQQKNDLALLAGEKGVLIFRNQDFKFQPFAEIKDWAEYFGPLHVHPTSSSPLNRPEFHLVFRRGSSEEQSKMFQNRLSNLSWHSDVSYENQPPAITLFSMLQTGESGGDTQFLDMFEVYDRLSPLLKEKIDGLKVLHSSRDQASLAQQTGGIQRKDPIDSIHPLVRYHPVLKRKCLFISRSFSTRILGLKQDESDNLLLFLLRHIEACLDAHVRVKWDANTVIVWDNRRLIHTATTDWDSNDIRHAFRVTTLGERPIGCEVEYDQWTPELEEKNISLTDYYAGLTPADYYGKVIKKNDI